MKIEIGNYDNKIDAINDIDAQLNAFDGELSYEDYLSLIETIADKKQEMKDKIIDVIGENVYCRTFNHYVIIKTCKINDAYNEVEQKLTEYYQSKLTVDTDVN